MERRLERKEEEEKEEKKYFSDTDCDGKAIEAISFSLQLQLLGVFSLARASKENALPASGG